MPIPTRWALSRLGAWATAATGLPILQADQAPDLARPSLPYLGLSRLPGGWETARARRTVGAVETAWTLSFAGVLAGDPAGVWVADELVEVSGLSAGAARDAWLAALVASYLTVDGWIVATSSGASGVTLATGAGWAPPRVEAGQQVAVVVTASEVREVWRAPISTRWRLQVYGSPSPEGVLGALRRAFERDPSPGLSRMSLPTVLSLPSGGGREVRGFVDLDVALEDLWSATLSPLTGATYAPELAGLGLGS